MSCPAAILMLPATRLKSLSITVFGPTVTFPSALTSTSPGMSIIPWIVTSFAPIPSGMSSRSTTTKPDSSVTLPRSMSPWSPASRRSL